ncbi:hypothetical protein LINGRAHAP2_LOCUS10932 [Linum grandiflorum]
MLSRTIPYRMCGGGMRR